MSIRLTIAYVLGGCTGLLLARLVLGLLAARPDNPAVQSIFAITAPLVAPLAFLDSGQPRFGAILEFSTLALILLLPLLALAAWLLLKRQHKARPNTS